MYNIYIYTHIYTHAEVCWLNQAVGLDVLFRLQPLQRGRRWWDSVWVCFAQAGIQAVDPSMLLFPAGNKEDVADSIQQIWHPLFCTVGFHRRKTRSCFRLACRGPESHVHRPSRNPLGREISRISDISFGTSLLSIYFGGDEIIELPHPTKYPYICNNKIA